jgi:transcriptional regulator with XRE-family HTH domain
MPARNPFYVELSEDGAAPETHGPMSSAVVRLDDTQVEHAADFVVDGTWYSWPELGAVFREQRESQERTRGEVAKKAGVSERTIATIERGDEVVSQRILNAVAGALGFRVEGRPSGEAKHMRRPLKSDNPQAKLRVGSKVEYHRRTWRVVDISRAGAYAADPQAPKFVYLVSDDADEIRETVPASTLLWGARERNPLEALRLLNPATAPAAAARKYRTFHEVEPHTVTERTCWVPGELVLLGAGIEINYKVNVVDSAKDNGASYVHKFEDNVKIYRRARAGEQPDVVWKNFPSELSVLGYALEFSFENAEGTFETKPAQHDKLATTPDGKTLVVIGSSGVKFVARGGKMKVTNWIYH